MSGAAGLAAASAAMIRAPLASGSWGGMPQALPKTVSVLNTLLTAEPGREGCGEGFLLCGWER